MRPPDSVVILQARVGSRRLPHKAMARIGGRTIVGRCLDRLSGCGVPVLLATTTNAEDDVLEREATLRRVPTVRGPVDDVLRRFLLAATAANARFIVRATADNPAVDIEAPVRVLETLTGSGADYVVECGLPYGSAVEAVTVDALRRADWHVTDPADREHVTSFVKRERSVFKVREPLAPERLRRPDLRLTIDTGDDLRFMEAVLSQVDESRGEAPLGAIIVVADRVRSQTGQADGRPDGEQAFAMNTEADGQVASASNTETDGQEASASNTAASGRNAVGR